MNAIGSLIEAGGDSLDFIMSHIPAISLMIVGIIVLHSGYRIARPRVRVKYEHQINVCKSY